MTVFVFGNAALEQDSLPLCILPELQKKFPQIEFRALDPNEEWDAPKEMIVIDTVMGIKDITVFDGLEQFSAAPRVSLHDFDAYANLRLLSKLDKLKSIKIIGVPADIDRDNAIRQICAIIAKRGSN
ncbi:MAG: hypothetical protein UY14_C0038G0009 [Parcubacteria group bacterium GW2011_GWA1_47_9]|uniref:Hydrogenase maturation protease n=1 Tax=candidate division WWE3 bacterium RIFCSPLOWO2_02_FULL_53_10 TaxID=1802629 RepID=A0A1F4WGX2_UNCKA|nr:MAG: hypothetical protein UY14_C0038G0009 [Parcubacteria group bacterium GW2011_GWA1_47_9]OGC68641.1 MAG: hypothetical protein A3J33_00340 [candidate division WWE3 bacterium RIFCSPLOWO2_02_FULL_53_10]